MIERNQPAPAKAGVIKTADWVIDLGPEGGVKGGDVVAVGTPEDVAKEPRSFTGAYLAPLLGRVTGSEPVLTGTTAKAGTQPSTKPRRSRKRSGEDQPDLIAAK